MSPEEDVVDVEFETIAGQNLSSSTQDKTGTPPPDDQHINGDQLTIFGSRQANQRGKALSLPVFTLIAAVCSVGAFYLAGGHILFGAPSQGSPTETALAVGEKAETKSLKIESVSSKIVERSNLKVLTIRATIANYDDVSQSVPTIIVRLGDDPATGRMFRINRGETLGAGERLVFTNSLPVGNAQETNPILTFAE